MRFLKKFRYFIDKSLARSFLYVCYLLAFLVFVTVASITAIDIYFGEGEWGDFWFIFANYFFESLIGEGTKDNSLFVNVLLNLFVTTILVTDINSDEKDDGKNLKLVIFCSFFTLTLSSVCSLILVGDGSFFYGATLLVIFLVINSLIEGFNLHEKLKIYLICLCAFLFGIGGIVLTFIGIISSVISYIILYNSTDFHKFFFSKNNEEEIDNSNFDENRSI